MELTFDIRGNLYPHQRNKLTLREFEEHFVKSFGLESSRTELFKGYLSFIEDFQKEVTLSFTQWINGSFVSNKQNPEDIDFVTLIEHSIYEAKRELIDKKYRLFGGKEAYEVDA